MMLNEGNYHNAADTSKGGWAVTDRIFGYMDKAGSIYNKIRYPQPGDPNYYAEQANLRAQQMGIFGLPKPLGGILLVGAISLVVLGVYKLVAK